MKKIILLPLDERPCNYNFPLRMPNSKEYKLVLPPKEILGDKKKPGNFEAIRDFLIKESKDAYGLIISVDTLAYGGIVPSRLHYLTDEQIQSRIDLIDKIKAANQDLTIFAFQLIMRCPWYSLSDEEPDYYDECGSFIHRYGYYNHLEMVGLLTEQQKKEQSENFAKIKPEYLKDYLDRRQKNIRALKYSLDKVKSGVIDYFVVPQDDAAVYGMTSLDQMGVRDYIKENGLQKRVNIYPGADETGMTLLARMAAKLNGVRPKFFVHYASSKGALVVPSFEDRPIDETIKYQIYAAGGIRVYSLIEADALIAVNIGSEMEGITKDNYQSIFDVNRNLCEFSEQIAYALDLGKHVTVCDVGQPNGGDIELVKMLLNEGLFFRLSGYAGWNTSSNTIGTAICQCITFMVSNDTKSNEKFLIARVLEDVCYCSFVRKKVTDEYLPSLNLNYFNAGGKNGEVAKIVKEEILKHAEQNFHAIFDLVEDLTVEMPWRRMFEVEIKT